MSKQPYIIRTYRPSDFDGYVQLHIKAENFDRVGHCTSPQTLAENLCQPNYFPEDDLFIAETTDGKIIGYVDVRLELGIGRAVFCHLVHHKHRDSDAGAQLFQNALQRASTMGARLAHVNIPEDDAAARGLLSRLGFRLVRRFLELRLELSGFQLVGADGTNYQCRHLQRGEEDRLAEIQNRSFAGTWGYNPNSIDEVVYRCHLSDCHPEGIILVWEGAKPLGYCWTTIDQKGKVTAGTRRGRIYMIGVDPGHRGKGIGRCALLAGLSYLKSRNIEVAELTVDSENKEACALYKSIGFKIRSTSLWYEKALE